MLIVLLLTCTTYTNANTSMHTLAHTQKEMGGTSEYKRRNKEYAFKEKQRKCALH